MLLASVFNRRAKQWISGRRMYDHRVTDYQTDDHGRTVWMHVSSLGEFEQGRPLIERWREAYPNDRILLSFFSPSGFTIRKDYPLADLVFYLPLDTKKNMNALVDRLRPDLFILVKYDFWPNLLTILQQRDIPCYLVSARFRKEQYLFKPIGSSFLKLIRNFKWIFVQDEPTAQLLKNYQFGQVMVAGDTRVDAVMSANRKPAVHDRPRIFIGGSTWPPEEKLLARLWKAAEFNDVAGNWKLIIAPHDISEEHLLQIEALFHGATIRHSHIEGPWMKAFDEHPIMIIDSIGLLSSLYACADMAFIGGGFGKGIHNTLEPAAYGIPVIFGPNWQKFMEAESLVQMGGAFPITDYDSFSAIVLTLCSDSDFRMESGNLALSYMKSQMGSSDLIIRCLLGKS